MSTDTVSTPPRPFVLWHLFALFWRLQITRARLVGLVLLGSVTIVLTLVARGADDPTRAATGVVAEFGLGVAVAIGAVWIGSSALGELVEDRLLVYLWLSPTPRWQVATAATGAALSVLVVVSAVPVTVAAVISGVDGLAAATALAALLTGAAYVSVFVLAGLVLKRALWWGLAYILIWENAVARVSPGTARLSILSYGRSILARATDVDLRLGDRAAWATWVVPVAVAVVGVVLTTWWLRRADID